MVRTQIQLTETQNRRLRELARREGISLAEAIRRCVQRALAEKTEDRAALYARAAELVGSLERPEGPQDLAENHDRYLEEAFE
ncbi:ribbon-helix-helix protein, CopG family [Deferrisoma camini]|uniref:ribbon-helix-helix protein, CopG family n=1 Tax=Deferrisoma camini TaxID=1035120 RepID=UPI00046C9300|nr:ribbon-helix-helix protein, CopG family [Deferrisoma camini]